MSPPDGTLDPRPRCKGHCCRQFALEFPHARVRAEFQRWQETAESSIPDIGTIAPMLVPLGVARGQELFTCLHHDRKSGNCTIYEFRPKMCRDFPGPNPCTYRNCASHGPQARWKRIWNWVRD
ncbi:MAG: YkgJ family cysteine cluster protein [Bdellovibrionales bacterium]|nr:YkgJ family cysteine cluster protein [Bdellovibrionales bacterium]